MEEIRWVSLKNSGALVAEIVIKSNSGAEYCFEKDITAGVERTVDIADAGGKFKDGDIVYLEVNVVWGKNRTASQRFVYRKTSNKRARYTIAGGTLTARLSYQGLISQYTKIAEPIRFLSLKVDNAGFYSRIHVKGGSSTYNDPENITVGEERILDLSKAGGKIQDGDVVFLEAFVAGGRNNTSTQGFVYKKSSIKRARYTISGMTGSNTLTYNGLSDFFTVVDTPVRFVELKNKGVFTSRIRVQGDSGTYVSESLLAGQELKVNLRAIKEIRNGEKFWVEVAVLGGDDAVGRHLFTCGYTSDDKVRYTISGTTKNNKLTYDGIFKVGGKEIAPTPYGQIREKIENWAHSHSGKSAWPGITVEQVRLGLNRLVFCQEYTNGYTAFTPNRPFPCSGVIQGDDYPICGPVAVMFYLAKVNLNMLADVVMKLYDTGSLMGYNVPKRLRDASVNVAEKYSCGEAPEVNWMFQASLAQMETSLKIELVPRVIKMFTAATEMKHMIKFVFNPLSLTELSAWGTTTRAKKNLEAWISHMKNGGAIFWAMHATPLLNMSNGTHSGFAEGQLSDLHWVVVCGIKTRNDTVILDVHSWGQLMHLELPMKIFRQMSHTSILFRIGA